MKTYYLYKKILSSIDETKIKFCHLDSCLGITLGDRIWIDHRANILEVLIHEVLHIIYPDFKESEIRKKTTWFIQKSSWFQKQNILRCIIGEK
jgi:predicted metal-dependent peptidase